MFQWWYHLECFSRRQLSICAWPRFTYFILHISFHFSSYCVKERKVDFKWHFCCRCHPVSWILQHKRVFEKLFLRKRDAYVPNTEQTLTFLFLSFMLELCPTQCSNYSDVHLIVGYLLPSPLNRSEAEGDLVIRNLLPLMCGLLCLRYSPSSINRNKVALLIQIILLCWKIKVP